jgi:hypothetical protein
MLNKQSHKIDRKKVYQILSVYVLALVAAIICGNGMGEKSTSAERQEVVVSK